MPASKKDAYADIAAITVTETGAATQTSAKFNFPFSITDKVAILIHRLEYYLRSPVALNSSGDEVFFGITVNPTVVNIANLADPLIVDLVNVQRLDMGTAASGMLAHFPIVRDLNYLPGGGILVAPNPLYAMIEGKTSTPAMSVLIRMFYTSVEMGTDEFWQLVQSRRIVGV